MEPQLFQNLKLKDYFEAGNLLLIALVKESISNSFILYSARIDSINCDNNELLTKVVNYYNNHKTELYTYLESGYVDLSNNLAERVVKPFVIARKNFLFCKTADGAATTGKLFSIVQIAMANSLKSEQYLTYVLKNINKIPIDNLLPWSDKLPKDLHISNN